MYKYTWCIYNLRTLTPTRLRRTKIGFIFLLSNQFRKRCNIPTKARAHGPWTGWVLGPCAPFQLLRDPSFRRHRTEKPLWTRKRYLTCRRALVFTRSEKFVLNNKRRIFLLLQRRHIIALLPALQRRKPKPQMYLKSNVYNFILHIIPITCPDESNFRPPRFPISTSELWISRRYFELWVGCFEPLTFHTCTGVMCSQPNLWWHLGMQISQTGGKFPLLSPEQTSNKKLSGRLPELRSRRRPAAPFCCTLDTECGLFGPLAAWLQSAEYCCGINICNASNSQQLLRAWNDLDPPNYELFLLSPFSTWTFTLTLHWSAV